jgi:hypothetical protein
MPRCKPGCVRIFPGTDRQKWNYVKSQYLRNYTIDSNGDRVDTYSESAFTEKFQADWEEWQATQPSKPFEKWLQWRFNYGTAQTGNLPQHKVNDHEGHCWMPCPYSTASSDDRSEIMWELNDDPEYTKNDHGIYYMETHARGSVWGFQCTYSGCPYYIGEGKRYFYK